MSHDDDDTDERADDGADNAGRRKRKRRGSRRAAQAGQAKKRSAGRAGPRPSAGPAADGAGLDPSLASRHGLRPREARFVREYLVDLNAAHAAARAGAPAASARQRGSEMLRRPRVKAAIDEAVAARAERTALRAEDILAEIDSLATSDIGEILDFTGDEVKLRPGQDIPARARRWIQSMKVKRRVEKTGEGPQTVEVIEFRLWDKPANLRLAAQHRGMLVERHEHMGKDGEAIPITVVEVVKPAEAKSVE